MKTFGVGKNATYLSLALIIQKILSFVYFYFLSSNIAPDTLGRYVFALSYTSLFSIFAELGLTPLLIRESSRSPESSGRYLRNIFSLKIPLACIVLIAVAISISLSAMPQETKNLVYLSSLIMLLDAFTISLWGVMRAHQNMLYESIGTILIQVIIFTFGISALFLTGNILLVMLALTIASAFNFVFAYGVVRKKLKFSLMPSWDKETIRYFLRMLPAFALGGIFVKIYNHADSVLLGFYAKDLDVGLYSIPAKTITALSQIIPFAFAAALFPLFSKYYIESREMLKKIFVESVSYLFMLSLPIMTGLLVFIPFIMKFIWSEYSAVSYTFIIMALAIPFIFTTFSTGYLLNASDRQALNTRNRGWMAGITILLNMSLIPAFTHMGAGITFLLVNILVLILDVWAVKKVIDIGLKDFMSTFTKTAIACIIMAESAVILLHFMHFIPAGILSGIIYLAVIVASGLLDIGRLKKRIFV